MAGFADRRAVEEIAGVELDAGLVGEQFEDAAAAGILDPRHQMEIAGRRAGDDVIVVIALAEADLRVAPVADAGADHARLAEIERGAGDRRKSPVGIRVAPTGVIAFGRDGQRAASRMVRAEASPARLKKL